MIAKQSVINTFERVGIDYKPLIDLNFKTETIANRFTGETCEVTPLVFELIDWVYRTSNAYEAGNCKVNISDFDRVRYYILEQDKDAYNTCID